MPRRHDRLEVAGLGVPRRVRGDPVEGGVEERHLVVQPGVGVVATAGSESPRPVTSRDHWYPDHGSPIGTRRPSAVTRTMSACHVLDSGNIWKANSLWSDQ